MKARPNPHNRFSFSSESLSALDGSAVYSPALRTTRGDHISTIKALESTAGEGAVFSGAGEEGDDEEDFAEAMSSSPDMRGSTSER